MRETLRNLIRKIRNNKDKASNDRFVVADVLDKLNDEKYGSEDSYTKEEVNNLIAGQMSGSYVPMAGTTIAKPFFGTLVGRPENMVTTDGFFTIGPQTAGERGNYGLNIRNYRAVAGSSTIESLFDLRGYMNFSVSDTPQSGIKTTTGHAVNPGTVSTWIKNETSNVENHTILNPYGYEIHLGLNSANAKTWNFNDVDGFVGGAYYTPTKDNQYVQKKYVDDKISGGVGGYIPLTGANNITGALIATSYFTPANDNSFIQKKYVDDKVGAVPTNFIPLVGSTGITGKLQYTTAIVPTDDKELVNKKYVDDKVSAVPNAYVPLVGTSAITGGLSGNAYFPPVNANSFVQQKYVDDKVATVPTNFIPLAGSSAITGKLQRTTYVAPTDDKEFTQKKYVDDKVSAVPTNFIPLAGSTGITGKLQYTTAIVPTDDKELVNKKYVDDKVGQGGGGNYIPMTGTTTTPVTGKVTFMGSGTGGVEKINFGDGYDIPGGDKFGIDLYATNADGVTYSQFKVNSNKFSYTNDINTSGYFAYINADYSQGIQLSTKNGRGESSIVAQGGEVRVYCGDVDDVVIFKQGHTGTSTIRDNDLYSPSDFIQKDYHDFTNSWEQFNVRKIGGTADMDATGVNMQLHTIMVKVNVLSSSIKQEFDLTNLSARRIFKVEGICVSNNGLEERMLNTYDKFSKLSLVKYSAINTPEKIELNNAIGDAWDGYVLLYITYIK